MTLTSGFLASGYPLATTLTQPGTCLVEVYPHPALLSLLNANYRVKYKVSRARQYWKEHTLEMRIREVCLGSQIKWTGLVEFCVTSPPGSHAAIAPSWFFPTWSFSNFSLAALAQLCHAGSCTATRRP